MDEVKCYRCGRAMRRIMRLGVFFCDNDGYILSFNEAAKNGLVHSEPAVIVQNH